MGRKIKIIIALVPLVFIVFSWSFGMHFKNNKLRFVNLNGINGNFVAPSDYMAGLSYLRVTKYKDLNVGLGKKAEEQSVFDFYDQIKGRNKDRAGKLVSIIILAKVEKKLRNVNFKLLNCSALFLLTTLMIVKSGSFVFLWWWGVVCVLFAEIGLFGFGAELLTNGLAALPKIIKTLGDYQSAGVNDIYWFLFIYLGLYPSFIIGSFIVFLFKHVLPKRIRTIEDFFKYDKDKNKRKELNIEDVYFKKIKFNIKKKIKKYLKTDKYFLGVSDENKDILLIDEKVSQHVHILGPTGSGKTSMAVLPLSIQSIKKGRGACFIDFKGDELLKKVVYKLAKENNKKFWYFSIDPAEKSSCYNPLYSGNIESKVDRIMSALNLNYEGPASFYSNVQTMTFNFLLRDMVRADKEILFETVREELSDGNILDEINVKEQEVKGLLAVLTTLASTQNINNNEIDLGEIIKNEDIVFFALKSQVNTEMAEAIGRMIIIDLKYQAVRRNEINNNFFIYIDEFQNLASEHFVDVISKVRSSNFCLVLSNQSRGNLFTVSPSFENTVFTNTATKIIFNQEDPQDAAFWSEKSGKTQYEERGMRLFSGHTLGGDYTVLDGKRELEAGIQKRTKNFISQNIFLRLPQGKSIIFLRQQNASLCNHEHYFEKEIRGRILREPFPFKTEFSADTENIKYKKSSANMILGQKEVLNKYLRVNES